MIYCHNHPDREARVACQKANIRGYCEECLEAGRPCFDPGLYCKFRGQCVINEMARENGKTDNAASEPLKRAAAQGKG